LQRSLNGHDAKHFAIGADHANAVGNDVFVHTGPGLFLGRALQGSPSYGYVSILC
jgi:hypothetical protein